jgi:hypothetical protein
MMMMIHLGFGLDIGLGRDERAHLVRVPTRSSVVQVRPSALRACSVMHAAEQLQGEAPADRTAPARKSPRHDDSHRINGG